MKTVKRKKDTGQNLKPAGKRSVVSTVVNSEFLRFIEYHPASRVNRNLRKMLLEFLMSDGVTEAFYFKDLMYDLEGLFELLDTIESENG